MHEAIAEAARLIASGQPVAVATETVYGLAADATNAEAVARIYEAKGRPSFNPLIVHVPDLATAERIGEFSAEARALAERHWPGPLTLVVPLRSDAGIAGLVTAGLLHHRDPRAGSPGHAGAAQGDRQTARCPVGQRQRLDQPHASRACGKDTRRAHPADHRRRANRTRSGIDHRCRDRRATAPASSADRSKWKTPSRPRAAGSRRPASWRAITHLRSRCASTPSKRRRTSS